MHCNEQVQCVNMLKAGRLAVHQARLQLVRMQAMNRTLLAEQVNTANDVHQQRTWNLEGLASLTGECGV